MIKKSLLPLFAAAILSCISTAHGQFDGDFNPVGDLNQARGAGPLDNVIFDISDDFGEAFGAVQIRVNNAYVSDNAASDAWTVSDTVETTFTSVGTMDVIAFVNHGRNLGSADFTSGSGIPRDGIRAASGETWTFTTDDNPANFDTDLYTVGSSANDYFVDYTFAGTDPDDRENNPIGFRWQSDQPVTSFTVFSTNTAELDNNYTVGFQIVNSIPEPTSAAIVALGGLLLLRRKRS